MKSKSRVSVYGYPSGEIIDTTVNKLFNVSFSAKFKRVLLPQKHAIDNKVVYRFLDKNIEQVKRLLK